MMGQIRELQHDMALWRDYNFPEHTADHQLMGVVEEVGELSHAHLKSIQRIRGFAEGLETRLAKEDAVADLFVFLTGYCSRESIDLENAIISTWSKVKERDWQLYPETGRPPDGS